MKVYELIRRLSEFPADAEVRYEAQSADEEDAYLTEGVSGVIQGPNETVVIW